MTPLYASASKIQSRSAVACHFFVDGQFMIAKCTSRKRNRARVKKAQSMNSAVLKKFTGPSIWRGCSTFQVPWEPQRECLPACTRWSQTRWSRIFHWRPSSMGSITGGATGPSGGRGRSRLELELSATGGRMGDAPRGLWDPFVLLAAGAMLVVIMGIGLLMDLSEMSRGGKIGVRRTTTGELLVRLAHEPVVGLAAGGVNGGGATSMLLGRRPE
mmetsp:Transcript_107540/g.335288  ORF Transcript_107540/g.335288 Transcript_107540/m.335288 type:complete len:215 (-) Transcript_107540:428-1072(-)